MVKIFFSDISAVNADDTGLPLSEARQEKLEKITSEQARRQSAGAELLICHAVKTLFPGAEIPVRWYADSCGKPHFEPEYAHFSLSHAANAAVCAISDKPVGVDAEKLRRIGHDAAQATARRFFTSRESADVALAADAEGRFMSYWVMKESFMKAVGKGFYMPMNSFFIAQGRAFDKNGDCGYEFGLFNADGYIISVCAQDGAGAAGAELIRVSL